MPRRGDVTPGPPRQLQYQPLARHGSTCHDSSRPGRAGKPLLSGQERCMGPGRCPAAAPGGSWRPPVSPGSFRGMDQDRQEAGGCADVSLKEACGAKGTRFKSRVPVADRCGNRGARNWGQPRSPRVPARPAGKQSDQLRSQKVLGNLNFTSFPRRPQQYQPSPGKV